MAFNDGLVLTHPEWIKQIQIILFRDYLNAGADCAGADSNKFWNYTQTKLN